MSAPSMRVAASATDQQGNRDAAPQQPPPRTSYQRREILAAVNRERARCAGILARAIGDLEVDAAAREVLAERLDRIRRPWRTR